VLGPIFNREFLTVPRRDRHYMTRVAYLGTLWVIGVTAWLATVGWTRSATLGETARFGPLLFKVLTLVQLLLFLFFSALGAASAVAQEKDRRTFVLLLMTDLRNREIVLGKLFGSMLAILILLAATVPVLMLNLLLGGVALSQVVQAMTLVTATTLAAGSLGGLIALWRDRTFQALALTVLFLVLYLCLVRGLGLLPLPGGLEARDWQPWLDPFLALETVHDPLGYEGARIAPAYGCAAVMLGFSVVLNGWGLLRLRVWNPSGEPIMQRERPEDEGTGPDASLEPEKDRVSAHAAPGAVRHVEINPILWREVYTRAYGRRPLLVKSAYSVVLFLICYYALAPLFHLGDVGLASALGMAGAAGLGVLLALFAPRLAPRRPWVVTGLSVLLLLGVGLFFLTRLEPTLGDRVAFAAAYGLVPVGVLSLLLVAAQATTAITSERDIGALDLLLVTDLTPHEFIFGKLWGICYNTKEYLLPPLLLAGLYAAYGFLATPPAGHKELEGPMNATALVCVAGAGLVLLAFAVVLGVHVALRTPNSRLAIIHTLSTIFFLTVGTLVCIGLILINGRFEYQWSSFVFFLVAGVGGLWWVLSGDRPSAALTCASWFCPLSVYYAVVNILVAKPGSQESADPLWTFLVIVGAFGFAVAAMLVPLLSEFDVALGRTTGGAD
jgi:ABC-type Na+ efflux pump permease subunit